MADASAKHISVNFTKTKKPPAIPEWDESRVTDPDERIVVAHNWDELRRFMWDYVGIVRTDKRLERAAHRIDLLKEEIRDYYSNFKVSSDLLELRNLVTVADLTVQCALNRRESRGLHYTLSHPKTKRIARDSVIVPTNYPAHANMVSWD
jgi:L-aspartate oxidase